MAREKAVLFDLMDSKRVSVLGSSSDVVGRPRRGEGQV
jgi:hypothetical protein